MNTKSKYQNQTLFGKFVSPEQITLIFSNDTVTADKSHPRYSEIFEHVKAGNHAAAADAADIAAAADAVVEKIVSGVDGVTVTETAVLLNGKPLNNVISDRILSIVKEGANPDALVKFLANLLKNPSYTAVQELYLFLEYNQIPLTEDGHFLAWKRVRNDFKDIHSGKIDYSVGNHPEMPRNEVDEDRNQTCSRGLHVCGWSYLPQFGGVSGDRIVIVKVNPADVVAVPSDYANAKMRVSKMEVLREYNDTALEAVEFSKAVVSSDGVAYDDSNEDDISDDDYFSDSDAEIEDGYNDDGDDFDDENW